MLRPVAVLIYSHALRMRAWDALLVAAILFVAATALVLAAQRSLDQLRFEAAVNSLLMNITAPQMQLLERNAVSGELTREQMETDIVLAAPSSARAINVLPPSTASSVITNLRLTQTRPLGESNNVRELAVIDFQLSARTDAVVLRHCTSARRSIACVPN